MPINISTVKKAADIIRSADAIIIGAGAGMGVDSGLPDFRGNEGFWKAYPALAQAKIEFSQIANPQSFQNNIRRGWGFYGHRLNLYRQTLPHQGFTLLRHMAETKPWGYFIYTSNVDGQFQKAGFDQERIYECHGSIHHLQCLEPCCEKVWSANSFHPQIDEANCLLINKPPACPECGGYARPNILMFGDWGWIARRSSAQESQLDYWLSRIKKPVVIEMGAGTHIPSVRYFSHRMSQEYGASVIRINPREAEVDSANDVGLDCGALEGLSAIADYW